MCRGHIKLKTATIILVNNSRISIRYDKVHRAAPTTEQHSALAHYIGHVVRTYCPMKWKSWNVMSDEVRTQVSLYMSTNYNLKDINDESLAYVNRLFVERYKQWKSDLHQYFQTFDDPHVVFEEGCPKEFKGREDNWAWLCGDFQEPDYVGGSKFPKIYVFSDVYVRPRDELAESLYAMMMEKRQLVIQKSTSQLPTDTLLEFVDPPEDVGLQILTETLDQTLRWRPGTYCRGWAMPNSGNLEPLHHRSQIVRPSVSPTFVSWIYVPHRPPSPSNLSMATPQPFRALPLSTTLRPSNRLCKTTT
ncbi:hypothetical protein C1H46_031257 [Malus baccata]|uniref:Uncharacterized protein n=1 Tax=Malus baccata TaxID=106549 RepID=A0A540LAB2_MALBA|nr:hypothetical protein C1H46_031257 [Malus baccata]